MTREPLRVLMLEHVAVDAELHQVELERAGYAVSADVVDTLADFTALLAEDVHDVILADYRLPGWTGLDAFAEVQARGRDIPFILVTGTLGEERAVECVKLGVADYVLKHNLARLPLAVRRAMGERRIRAERGRATELIRKLTQAVEQGPAAVIITDTAGSIEYVNRRFTELTGFTPQDALGRNPRILRSAHTPAETYRELWTSLHEGRVWHGEMQNRMKSGAIRWHDVIVAPVRDAAGTITNFIATQEDVTERKRAEHALVEREERFRQLAENIREIFFVVDVRLAEALYVSPAYEVIWGRSCRTVYERPGSALEPIVEADREGLLAAIAAVRQGRESAEAEFRVLRPDGQTRWVRAHAVPLRNDHGEVYRICGAALDVTDRHGVQAALADSEALFRQFIEASFDAILITEDGVVIDANRGFAELCGCSLEQVIGQRLTDFVAEESIQQVAERITAGVEGTYQFVGRRADGRRLSLEATSRTLTTSGGRRRRLTALRDLTEKRALESQFQQAQKMEAVGRLAGGVAHDFNNLLTVITSYTELLLDDLTPGSPQRADLEQVRKAAQGAADLTRQLLAFSHQQVLEPRRLNLDEAVRGAERLLRRLIGEDIELDVQLGEGATVRMDPGHLEQIIMNLAVNARDAMPSGGRLAIGTDIVSVDAATAQAHGQVDEARYARLTVIDTGIGMDEATRARLFEPFFTTKGPGKGTGLGLSTVDGIVKQSGGFIEVASERGRGASFGIYLPLLEEPADGEAPAGTLPVPGGDETVLLVEDATAVRMAARLILERCGYTVMEAPGAEEALALAAVRRAPIHLLLTDLVMPRISGPELANEFLRLYPAVRVLYMSGYTSDDFVRHHLTNADAPYLQKPFSPDGLCRKVREALDLPSEVQPVACAAPAGTADRDR